MLSRPAAFSLLGAVLLGLSLGTKALVLDLATEPDIARFNSDLARKLEAQGFSVRIEDKVLDLDVVHAVRGNCRMVLRSESSADLGTSFRKVAADLPVLRYRYAGQLRDGFPRGWYDLANLFNRIALRLGLAQTSEQPLAIAASSECDLGAIDFGRQVTWPKVSPRR
ncbi:hypothetical protein OKA06_15100 [Novosphingobium sp. MW5]|nr:hypothetical protein [Novosphingobium sp. MW5]